MAYRRVVTVLVMIPAGIGAYLLGVMAAGRPTPPAAPATDQSVIVPAGKDWFGDVWESSDFAWSFPVVNTSSQAVTVTNVTGSCTCLSVSPTGFTLEPGQTQVVNARFDFTAKPRQDDDATFPLSYQAADGSGQLRDGRWLLSGRVRKLVTLDRPLYLGRHSVLAQPLKPQSVEGRVAAPFESVTITPLTPGLRVEAGRGETSDRFRLVVTPTERYPIGELKAAATLTVKLTSGESWSQRVMITGDIVPDVEPSPPAYPGGGRQVGETFEFEVSLASATGTPFTVADVKVIGEGLGPV